MLTDRDIVNLVLESKKHEAEDLTKAALESSGALRQTLLQMRAQCETAQEQLAQFSIQKGWYQPAAPAAPQDVQSVAQFYNAAEKQPAMRI